MDKPLTLPWLLVATPQLQDTNFRRAVVLVVEHSSHGTMGFVINRPTQASLANLVTVPHLEIPANVPAWYGGPVERSTGIILHNRTSPLPGGEAAEDDNGNSRWLALSSSEQTLIDLVDYSIKRTGDLSQLTEPPQVDGDSIPAGGLYPYRFLIGYAGWGPGQLTDELHQGAWIQAPATQELLFNTSWKNLWERAMGTIGVNPKTLVPSVHSYLN